MDGLSIKNSNLSGGIGKISNAVGTLKPNAGVNEAGESFADTLKNAVGKVNELQVQADVKMLFALIIADLIHGLALHRCNRFNAIGQVIPDLFQCDLGDDIFHRPTGQ